MRHAPRSRPVPASVWSPARSDCLLPRSVPYLRCLLWCLTCSCTEPHWVRPPNDCGRYPPHSLALFHDECRHDIRHEALQAWHGRGLTRTRRRGMQTEAVERVAPVDRAGGEDQGL